MLRPATHSRIAPNVPLADKTTLGIGGPAQFLCRAESADDIFDALHMATTRALPVTILGGGSNVLIADAGIPGIVIQPAIRGFSSRVCGNIVKLRVAAGELWDAVVLRAVAAGWQGIECLSGIPGWAGAAPVQNIGAYGQEAADVIASVEAIDRRTLRRIVVPAAACGFAYRESHFKREPGRFIITAVTLNLHRNRRPAADYAGLRDALPARPSLMDVRQAVLETRAAKSMLAAHLAPAGDANAKSAGSFFVNPIVPESVVARVRALAAEIAPGEKLPEYATHRTARNGEPMRKLSAAWLIERAGLPRGFGRGNVGISTAHTLALVNRGAATAAELLAFQAVVQARVRDVWGIDLAREPVALGDFEAAAVAAPKAAARAA